MFVDTDRSPDRRTAVLEDPLDDITAEHGNITGVLDIVARQHSAFFDREVMIGRKVFIRTVEIELRIALFIFIRDGDRRKFMLGTDGKRQRCKFADELHVVVGDRLAVEVFHPFRTAHLYRRKFLYRERFVAELRK